LDQDTNSIPPVDDDNNTEDGFSDNENENLSVRADISVVDHPYAAVVLTQKESS
jgi:hypothetical protein